MLYPLSYGGPHRSGVDRTLPEPTSTGALRPISVPTVTDAVGRVLVVDDDEVIRQLVSVNLSLEGFEVETAVDGQDCLDRVHDFAPDVVTLDVMMPRVDGWTTAGRLRQDPATSHIKVMFLTARAQADDLQHGHEIGVDAYVTKPFDPSELIRVVRGLASGETERG